MLQILVLFAMLSIMLMPEIYFAYGQFFSLRLTFLGQLFKELFSVYCDFARGACVYVYVRGGVGVGVAFICI